MTWNWIALPASTTHEQLLQALNRRLKALEQALEIASGLSIGTGTFTDADATPSVANIRLGITANTGATTITTFDDGIIGQVVTIRFGDGNTTLAHGATLQLIANVNFTGATGDMKAFITDDGTNWYEVPQPPVWA